MIIFDSFQNKETSSNYLYLDDGHIAKVRMWPHFIGFTIIFVL